MVGEIDPRIHIQNNSYQNSAWDRQKVVVKADVFIFNGDKLNLSRHFIKQKITFLEKILFIETKIESPKSENPFNKIWRGKKRIH